MKSHATVLGVTIAFVALSAVSASAVKPKIEAQVVGPRWVPGMVFTVSPKGMLVAATYAKDGQWVVAIDGKEGEPYDEILKVAGRIEPEFNEANVIVSQSIVPPGPVALSRDGKRYAYAGRRGADVIVIVDGKEMFRAPHSHVAAPVSLLHFSPDGKRLFFYSATGDTLQSFRVMMDGKPATPAFEGLHPILFSPDGSRWLLNAGKAKQPLEKLLVVDGKDVGYAAERGRFSPDGKRVVCVTGGRGEQKLLVDGKPLLITTAYIERFKMAANGDIAAIVQQSNIDQDQKLYLNGKLVPGVENVRSVEFSPDGKRWIARCSREMSTVWWAVLDGKKHPEYKSVSYALFSADSSQCAYIADIGPKKFLVTNGEENAGYAVMGGIVFAKTGNKSAYAAGPNFVNVYHDGKVSPQFRTIYGLALSPDGNRLAYFGGDSGATGLIVDGEKIGNAGNFGGKVFFSPDSKHVVARTWDKEGDTIYLDGTFLPSRRSIGQPLEFTPDSQHLIVSGSKELPDRSIAQGYFLDGEPVANFSNLGVVWAQSPTRTRRAVGVLPFGVSTATIDPDAKDWEFQPDGSILFLGAEAGPEGPGPMKRIKVTPAPGTSFANWITDMKAEDENAAAAAVAAKEKAAADRAEKAAAAAQARKDAADSKAKAAADAAAAKKAKAAR